jgi:carboxypeptidase Q
MPAPLKPFLVLALAASVLHAGAPPEASAQFAAEARLLTAESQRSDHAYQTLASLCDGVGHRLSGSADYDRAVVWGLKAMKDAGLEHVHTEMVMVPHWVRNTESAQVLLPARHDLSILGLGGSVPTPPGGITADVVVVGSAEELDRMKDEDVKGRIVLFEMPFTGYGAMVRYRFQGPAMAAKKGAVGMLMRSIASLSFDTPHTGVTHYEPGVPAIPAACVSVENALMMRRMWARGERIQVHLEMNCATLPDVPAANVVGELVGSERPQEVVLVGGHLDSWDVGQGAQDDGVGCILSLEAAYLIHKAAFQPRRTVRVVFFANEENGDRGGLGYRDQHLAELPKHVAAFESDSGNGLIQGFRLDLHGADGGKPGDPARSLALLRTLGPVLGSLGAGKLEFGHSGVDVEPSVLKGVPGLGVNHDTARYWEVHHSKADTLDKVNPTDLARNSAILAVAVLGVADMTERSPSFISAGSSRRSGPGHQGPGAGRTQARARRGGGRPDRPAPRAYSGPSGPPPFRRGRSAESGWE